MFSIEEYTIASPRRGICGTPSGARRGSTLRVILVADEACTYKTLRQGPLNFVISAAYGVERARPKVLCTPNHPNRMHREADDAVVVTQCTLSFFRRRSYANMLEVSFTNQRHVCHYTEEGTAKSSPRGYPCVVPYTST